MTEYCLIKNGIVIAVIVADEVFARAAAEAQGATYILRPSERVGQGHTCRAGKFYRVKNKLDENGLMTGETEEEEIV